MVVILGIVLIVLVFMLIFIVICIVKRKKDGKKSPVKFDAEYEDVDMETTPGKDIQMGRM